MLTKFKTKVSALALLKRNFCYLIRDYKKRFGAPPQGDIAKLRTKLGAEGARVNMSLERKLRPQDFFGGSATVFWCLFGVYNESAPGRLKRIVTNGETLSKISRRKLLAISN